MPAAVQQRELDRQRLGVVLLTVGINVVTVGALAFAPWSDWRTGAGLNIVNNAILLAHLVRRRDALLGRLMIFGLAAGFVELLADAWLVDSTGTLDYSVGGGPMLWKSPLWMPFAWEVVAVQFGCIGMHLVGALGRVRGALLTGLLGAINIPYYEEMARLVHWWRYEDARMLLHTPWYIIVGEFFIAAGFALLAVHLRRVRAPGAIGLGAIAGLLILGAYAGAYVVIERIL